MNESWHNYFIRIAVEVASRATCDRKHVGCVLVRDRTILSTGYNGSLRGAQHCDDVGHDMLNNSCVRTVHAEQNAICQAAKNGISTDNADAYVTAFPCWNCFKTLVNSGIKNIYYLEGYRNDERVVNHASQLGISIVQVVQS